MRIICVPTLAERDSGRSWQSQESAKELEVPEGYVISKIETVHPHSFRDMSVAVIVHLEREGHEPLVLKFYFEAFFYAVTGTETSLVQ